jgi:hypothetical protein
VNEREKKIAEKILKRIEEHCDAESISNYLNFLEAVKIRIAVDSQKTC